MIICRVLVPNSKKEIILFGTWEKYYSNLPLWVQYLLDTCDVIFMPGKNGLSFVDPFSTEAAIFHDACAEHVNWHDALNLSHRPFARALLNLFLNTYYAVQPEEQLYSRLRYWAIKEIIDHVQEFYSGDELSFGLYVEFFEAHKVIKSLDAKELDLRLKALLQAERYVCKQQNKTGVALAASSIQKSLHYARLYFPDSDDEADTATAIIDQCNAYSISNLQLERYVQAAGTTIDYVNMLRLVIMQSQATCRESIAAPNKLYCTWLPMLMTYLKESDPQEQELICMYLPMPYIPQLMTYFAYYDWPQEMIQDQVRGFLTEKTKSLLFRFQLERRAYNTIRDAIICQNSNPNYCHLKI